jgi:hypothetical protein
MQVRKLLSRIVSAPGVFALPVSARSPGTEASNAAANGDLFPQPSIDPAVADRFG